MGDTKTEVEAESSQATSDENKSAIHMNTNQTTVAMQAESTTYPKLIPGQEDDGALINQAKPMRRPSSGETETKTKKRPEDFLFGKVLGEGSYSTVYLAKEVKTGVEYAIKVVDKRHIIKEKKVEAVTRERDVLSRINHPFFVRLFFTFQDVDRLYFTMNCAKRGELLEFINKLECFDEECTRFYSAEIVSALEYLHSKSIIHRDLKPENILLNEDMHIQITDFGSSKILKDDKVLEEVKESPAEEPEKPRYKRKNSFVGTAQYVSPEVLNGEVVTYSVDLWALGCIVYQFSSGQLPFWGGHEYQIFQKIIKLEYKFPAGFHAKTKDLVENLLVLDPTKRLGSQESGGYDKLKGHSFFTDITWDTLPQQTPPTLQPFLPANDESSTDFYSNLKPGFDPKQIGQLVIDPILKSVEDKEKNSTRPKSACSEMKKESWFEKTFPKSQEERSKRLKKQADSNEYHKYVSNNLILHQGFLDKRKGLFARKRMFLLTEGPHLYYVDTGHNCLKGQIPWSKHLRAECKDFKIFFVHTPNRIYYLEDRYERNALDWCQKITEVWQHYFEDKDKVT